jgi:hypothetical protein
LGIDDYPSTDAFNCLALALFVAGIALADYVDVAFAANHLALGALDLNRRFYSHDSWMKRLHSLDDPTLASVGIELYLDFVSYQHPDAVHPHLAGEIRQYLGTSFELDSEEGVGQGFGDDALDALFVLVCHYFERWAIID